MAVYDIGRVAVKTRGREAGLRCVVVDIIDRSFVLVDGPQVRRKRCNVNHLIPVKDMVKIEKGADSDAVKSAISSAKLADKFEKRIKIDL